MNFNISEFDQVKAYIKEKIEFKQTLIIRKMEEILECEQQIKKLDEQITELKKCSDGIDYIHTLHEIEYINK